MDYSKILVPFTWTDSENDCTRDCFSLVCTDSENLYFHIMEENGDFATTEGKMSLWKMNFEIFSSRFTYGYLNQCEYDKSECDEFIMHLFECIGEKIEEIVNNGYMSTHLNLLRDEDLFRIWEHYDPHNSSSEKSRDMIVSHILFIMNEKNLPIKCGACNSIVQSKKGRRSSHTCGYTGKGVTDFEVSLLCIRASRQKQERRNKKRKAEGGASTPTTSIPTPVKSHAEKSDVPSLKSVAFSYEDSLRSEIEALNRENQDLKEKIDGLSNNDYSTIVSLKKECTDLYAQKQQLSNEIVSAKHQLDMLKKCAIDVNAAKAEFSKGFDEWCNTVKSQFTERIEILYLPEAYMPDLD